MSHGNMGVNIVAPRSPLYQGPFGRIFSELDPWSMDSNEIESFLTSQGSAGRTTNDLFMFIADIMREHPDLNMSPTEIVANENLRSQLEQDFSSQIPAGYTYFGQFVDHDITFDPASSLMRKNDPNGLLNHRTPRLDLDSVYGSGPDANPHMYQTADPEKFLIGNVVGNNTFFDLPRNQEGRAIIGDARNDENAIVAQIHLAFLLAHNNLVERARDLLDPNNTVQDRITIKVFNMVRKTLRWLYQHIVWNDFISRITTSAVFDNTILPDPNSGGRCVWQSNLESVYRWKNQPFMPVEFSVAAYRFGHSMVRNSYQTNINRGGVNQGFHNFTPIFDNSGNPNILDLRGSRPIIADNVIQWDWFLDMNSQGEFPQRARKIDTKLSNALSFLHGGSVGSPRNVLALRNLQRGMTFDLPSGSDVARKLGFTPMSVTTPEDLLWFYILNEAEVEEGGENLGNVGSTIVCAVFAGLLLGDNFSFFNMAPCWTPDNDPLLRVDDKKDSTDSKWELASIIRLAGLPVDGTDFP